MRYHFTHRAVEDSDMCLEKIEGAKNPADMLTKCVYVGKMSYAKPQLVFCSCCYICCGAVKMLMMKRIFFLRMYFLDD